MQENDTNLDDNEDKKLYYIFSKKEPQSLLDFTKDRKDISALEDVESHILIILDEFDDDYEDKNPKTGDIRLFLTEQQEEMEA